MTTSPVAAYTSIQKVSSFVRPFFPRVEQATESLSAHLQFRLTAEQQRTRNALDVVIHCVVAAESAMEYSNSPNSPEDQTSRSRSQLADRVKQDSRERIERGKQVAADQVEQLADVIDEAGTRLNDGQPTIASYATRLADGLDDLAQRLRRSSLEDLARDTRTLAVRNPGAYLLGSAAIGLLLARFLKASIDTDEESSSSGAGDFQSGSDFSSDEESSSTASANLSTANQTSGTSPSGSFGTAEDQAAGTAREPSSTSRGIH